MVDRDDNLLLRWSRRKHLARQGKEEAKATEPASPADRVPDEGATPAQPAETVAVADPSQQPVSAEADAEVRVEDLPDIETLTYDSDFSAFMREGVPAFIRQQALRKLWLSNPILANLDGLNDYDAKTMSFLVQELEAAAEPVAEIGRGLRDKIMDAKRARDDRPGERRSRPLGERRQPHSRAEPAQAAAPADRDDNQNAGATTPADPKRTDA